MRFAVLVLLVGAASADPPEEPIVGRNTPSIRLIDPSTAAPGAAIWIHGKNFSGNLESNIVVFGTVETPVYRAFSNQLIAVVPFDTPPGPVPVAVRVGDETSSPVSLMVEDRVPSFRTARARMHSLSVQFERAVASVQGLQYTLDFTSLEFGEQPNGELFALLEPGAPSHTTRFELQDPTFFEPILGELMMDLPLLEDEDQDGVWDFFQLERPATGTSRGFYGTEVDEGTVDASWVRQADATNGTCRIELTSAGFGRLPPFTANFRLFEYEGTMRYIPSTGLITALLEFEQTGNRTNVWRGMVVFERDATNGVDLLEMSEGTLTNATGRRFPHSNAFIDRSVEAGSNYVGLVFLADGNLETPGEDFIEWVISITDTNDSDGNGIPDFSDPPENGPTEPGRFTDIRRAGASVVLEWEGEGVLQGAAEVTGPWTEIPTEPNRAEIPVDANRRFFRLARPPG